MTKEKLREEIADIVWKRHGYYYDRVSAEKAADAILSLPTGLKKVKECHGCDNWQTECSFPEDKPFCDRGTVFRPLAIVEAIEFAKLFIEYQPDKRYPLPSGDILEVGE